MQKTRIVVARGHGDGGNGDLLFSEYSFNHARWKSSRDVLYNILLMVNNTLYTQNFAKSRDPMSGIFTTIL